MQTFTDLCARARVGHAIARRGYPMKKMGMRNTQSAEIRTFSAIIQKMGCGLLTNPNSGSDPAHGVICHCASAQRGFGQKAIHITRICGQF
jgi:hypothetical protein